MRKLIKTLLYTALLFGCLSTPVIAHAEEPTFIKGYATAYCQTGQTSSGAYTRDGICAGAKSYSGCMIVLYQRLPDGSLGDYIGMYECLDTGGTDGLNNGTVIDVWKSNNEQCQEFMNQVYEDNCKGHIYIQVIEGKG